MRRRACLSRLVSQFVEAGFEALISGWVRDLQHAWACSVCGCESACDAEGELEQVTLACVGTGWQFRIVARLV